MSVRYPAMTLAKIEHVCPSCGYRGLDCPPYANMPAPPWLGPEPPYSMHYGDPSYDVCDCCGFEYGNDDEPLLGVRGSSFEEYRREWIGRGCPWFDVDKRPKSWSLSEQLSRAGISVG
jgi:hypothetical protein